jgi:RNA polymerase sigma-70 factor (ECF subfamily)
MPSGNISQEFITFVDSHRKLIYKVCRMYCRNDAQMKDVEQEILTQLWTVFPKYNHTFRASTWIYRIALNTAISYYRREKKHISRRTDIDQSVFLLADEYEPDDTEEKIRRLYELMEQFSELDRALLLLYLDENSYEDIARVLGITVTNVAAKISRLKLRRVGG